MGGIRIIPDITVDEFDTNLADALILPGADTWLEPKYKPTLAIIQQCLESNVLVAAICGATSILAQAGILDNRKHTSNDLTYLQAVSPNYKGESFYVSDPAVTDGNLITATGLAPLEFAHEVLKYLDVMNPQTLNAWFKLFQTRDPKYFFALMGKD
ncbi:MAG TPA: DJ-1/PfpI family protein [Bacteroidales bacterium]|nr:DJ-1/PfpI family protein [Bacteroidales bacterium]